MSTISYNTKNSRTSLRGRQSSSNTGHSSRSGSKRPSSERFVPDGVYSNSRFTHVIYSLVGCVVQVQVKNGCIYEGVFRTVSPEMNVVLELAHKIEESRSSIPSRDRLIDKLIFGKDDVVALSAASVDLEYAVKDCFTDAAISRFNGQHHDRDVRELQPWDGETGDDINLLENDSSVSNGWDPNDMFKTNAEQFSVRSTYDENLTQYTTPLEKRDTKEYRQREEEAARLAKEIERSDDYKARIDLENGDGDEESKFSSVVRPTEIRGPSGNGSGKYIPPHNRRGVSGLPRRAVSDHGGQQRQISPSKTHLQHSPVMQHTQRMSAVNTSLGLKDEHTHPIVGTNINGEKDQKQSEPVLNKSSPEPNLALPVAVSEMSRQPSPNTIPTTDVAVSESPPNTNLVTPSKGDRRNPNPRGRQIQELKEFGENFKLTEELIERKGIEKLEEREDEMKDDSKTNLAERSKLNPMAREFVPTSQPRSQKTVPQTPTPPRPQTQSPVVQPIVPMYSQFIVPANMMPVGPTQTAQTQGNRYPKRAVVSVQPRPDFTAAAQHATGQPLLANATVPAQQYLPYPVMPSVMHQQSPAGYQVLPVTANPQRMMNPNPVAPSSHPGAGLDPSQSSSQQAHPAQHIFMPTGHGPVPAHMTPHHGQQMSHPQPAHVGTHPVAGNPQSQAQMTPVSGPHPAPSPVQHSGPGGQQHHPQGPPTSGTPQPQINYPQMGLQGHPQMQAPSHNPASPQASMHPYALTSHPHIQQGAQQFTFTQATQQQTSVSQTMHTHTHSPHMPQPQIVVMPQPPPHNQVQHTHHVQPQFQHGAHAAAAGHHLQGPAAVHGQGHPMMHHSGIGALPVSAASGVHPTQVHHFVPSVPSHGQGGPVQTGYPQTQ